MDTPDQPDPARAFRIGSPPDLNTAPLIRGLEDQIVWAPPADLALKLRKGELDAALVPVAEVLYHDEYEVLDGIAIASLGEVRSVLLAHRQPLEQIREIACDPTALTSVDLLRVLLQERGLSPNVLTVAQYEAPPLPDNVLLIGDQALDVALGPPDHELWDLGTAWYQMTQLPFVYAVWAMRRDRHAPALRQCLREARDFGMDTLDYLVSSRQEYTRDFRQDYLTWHIHYHLGADEKRGLARFAECLRTLQTARVFDPKYVD